MVFYCRIHERASVQRELFGRLLTRAELPVDDGEGESVQQVEQRVEPEPGACAEQEQQQERRVHANVREAPLVASVCRRRGRRVGGRVGGQVGDGEVEAEVTIR